MIIFKPHQAVDIIAPYLPPNPVIVEAGAYKGYETERLAKKWATGHIHSFEPVPQLFHQLKKNVAIHKHVHCYQLALSNTTGSACLYISQKKEKPDAISQANSLHKPKERLLYSPLLFPYTLNVPTISIDDWAVNNAIHHIDMLWLDTQGHEKHVIEGALSILPQVTIILSEVAFVEGYYNQLTFKEFTLWLACHNFHLIAQDFTTQHDWFFGNAIYARL